MDVSGPLAGDPGAPDLEDPGGHGRAAYEAYSGATGGRSAVTGDQLPAWPALAPVVRLAWTAAARAVADRVAAREGF